MNAAVTVINFGRTRSTAPWNRLLRLLAITKEPTLPRVVVREIQEQQHEDARLRVQAIRAIIPTQAAIETL